MTLEFTGAIAKAYEPKSGVSRNGRAWSVQRFYIEEVNDSQYKDGVIVEVWREPLSVWMRNNVGARVTISFSIRRDAFNDNDFNKVVCFAATYNGVAVGVEETAPHDNTPQPPRDILPPQVEEIDNADNTATPTEATNVTGDLPF